MCIALGPYGPCGIGGGDTAFFKISGEGVKIDVIARFLFVRACGCKSEVLDVWGLRRGENAGHTIQRVSE